MSDSILSILAALVALFLCGTAIGELSVWLRSTSTMKTAPTPVSIQLACALIASLTAWALSLMTKSDFAQIYGLGSIVVSILIMLIVSIVVQVHLRKRRKNTTLGR